MRFPAPLTAIVLAAALATPGCLVWKNNWRNSLAVATADGLAYVDDGDDKHRLDIYAPSGAQGAPVVIFIHGGFWRSGDRDYYANIVGLYGNVGTALADMGVVTVVPSYRLFPQVDSPEAMFDDLAKVIAFTRDHIALHGGDPNRIVLAGHSAGGHLAAFLATSPDALKSRGVDPSVVKAVVPISGIYDVVSAAAHADPPEDRQELWDPLFGDEGSKQAFSPLPFFTRADAPPMLFIIGENDYKNCLRDFDSAQKAVGDNGHARIFFDRVPGNTHEDMVLEIGTVDDDVGHRLASFAHVMTR